eukprot:g8264.t1
MVRSAKKGWSRRQLAIYGAVVVVLVALSFIQVDDGAGDDNTATVDDVEGSNSAFDGGSGDDGGAFSSAGAGKLKRSKPKGLSGADKAKFDRLIKQGIEAMGGRNGKQLSGEEDWEAAIAAFEEAVDLHPGSAEVNFFLAQMLMQSDPQNKRGRMERAQLLFEEVAESKDRKKKSERADAHYFHAATTYEMARLTKSEEGMPDALRALKDCLELQPGHKKALALRAHIDTLASKAAAAKAQASAANANRLDLDDEGE